MIDPIECPQCRKFTAFRLPKSDAGSMSHQCRHCGFALKAFFVAAGPAKPATTNTITTQQE